jgi:hypothetical protein
MPRPEEERSRDYDRMAQPQADQASVGLEKAAAEAPSALMREFARIASAERLTLGQLARRLNRRDGTALKHINVTRHFETPRPREATIASYAAVLGVSASYVTFVRGDPIPRPDVREALRRATGELRSKASQFRKNASLRAAKLISQTVESDDVEAERMARVFALAQMRAQFGVVDNRAAKHPNEAAIIGPALTALADYLRPRIDLLSEVAGGARDGRLLELQSVLRNLFQGAARDDIGQVIAFVVGLLRRRGSDTSLMEDSLDRATRETYRIGDWVRYDYQMDSEESAK